MLPPERDMPQKRLPVPRGWFEAGRRLPRLLRSEPADLSGSDIEAGTSKGKPKGWAGEDARRSIETGNFRELLRMIGLAYRHLVKSLIIIEC